MIDIIFMRINVSEHIDIWKKLVSEHTIVVAKRASREIVFNTLDAFSDRVKTICRGKAKTFAQLQQANHFIRNLSVASVDKPFFSRF